VTPPTPGTLLRYVLDHVLAAPGPVYAHLVASALREDRPPVNNALATLAHRGLLARLGAPGSGVYCAPSLAAAHASTPPPRPWRGGPRPHALTTRVRAYLRARGGEHPVAAVADALGISPAQAYGALGALVRAGEARRGGRWGRFVWGVGAVERGRAAA
jgi:DNA-binding IclR family transcriptional regulator